MGRTTAIVGTLALAGAALLLAACGGSASKSKDEGSGPPRETQAIEEGEATARTVEVNALFVRQGPNGASGGTNPVTVTVGPSDSGELKVSFLESEVGGAGEMWKAAGWTGVGLASLFLGGDPRQYEFAIDPGHGNIDGHSAGGGPPGG